MAIEEVVEVIKLKEPSDFTQEVIDQLLDWSVWQALPPGGNALTQIGTIKPNRATRASDSAPDDSHQHAFLTLSPTPTPGYNDHEDPEWPPSRMNPALTTS